MRDRRKEERKGKQIEDKHVLGKGSGLLEDSGVVLLHFWRKIISYRRVSYPTKFYQLKAIVQEF